MGCGIISIKCDACGNTTSFEIEQIHRTFITIEDDEAKIESDGVMPKSAEVICGQCGEYVDRETADEIWGLIQDNGD